MNNYARQVRARTVEEPTRLATYLDEGDSGELLLRIPHHSLSICLLLSTYGDETSTGFDRSAAHVHGDMLPGQGDEIQRSLDFLNAVLNDRVQICG